MELHQLRYLRSVVRSGSVTRAAELEHVSQPSISKQITLLERELGVQLFHRVGRRVVPTEAGSMLAECADRVLDDLSSSVATVAELRSSLRGAVRLCATETVTDNLLPPIIARLRARNPEIRLSVEMLGTDDSVAHLLADGVDLALIVLPLADSRLEVETLFEEEIRLTTPLGHRWEGRGVIELAAALAEPDLLLSMPGHGLRAQLEHEAQTRGLTLASPVEMRSQTALLNLVASGAGVAFAPLMSLDAYAGRLAILGLNPPLTRAIGYAVRRGRRLPPLAQALLSLLKEAVGSR